ncbi:MAG: HEPN domain-containing protein [Methanosarcinales archaeon]
MNRAYYCMYHSARAAVYVQMQLDVEKHQPLINKFRKLLDREFNNTVLADLMDYWRINRNECDYNPMAQITAENSNDVVIDSENILNTCKNLVEAF